MLGILIALFAVALLAPLLSRLGPKIGVLLAAVPAAGAIYLALRAAKGAGPYVVSFAWAPALGIDFSLYVDGLSTLFGLLVTVLGALVVIYAAGYFEQPRSIGRFYSLLFAFMGGMLGLVSAGNLIVLYLFWEITTITSFLLIGFDNNNACDRENARQALLVTAAGGLALLGGILLLGQIAGTYNFPELLTRGEQIRNHPYYLHALTLIFAGCFTKSAQVPFHFWLPSAMVAPTPVSAYLHSATMVKAGIFLLLRLQPALGGHPFWHYTLELFGAVTMLTGAIVAVVQTDLKRILAYSTISVLGMLVLLTGIGTEAALEAAMAYLLVHALYKGALFFVAGAVDRATGTRDVTRLGRLARRMPVTAVAGLLAALSMAGMPPLFGFISKELLYEAQIKAPSAAWLITSFGVTANMLLVTAALLAGVHPFLGKCKSVYKKAHEVRSEMILGPVLLALAGLMFGLFPNLLNTAVLTPAVSAVQVTATVVELQRWKGINPILLLSVFTVLCGVGLYFARRYLRWVAELLHPIAAHTPTGWYGGALKRLRQTADLHTRYMQHGYLAAYVWAILASTVIVLALALFPYRAQPAAGPASFWDWALTAMFLVNCGMLVVVNSRMAAIVGLSAMGVVIALVFGIYSGLDLAMVQFAVETLGIVLLLLVLLKLPNRYRHEGTAARRIFTGASALFAGTTLALLMYVSGSQVPGAMGTYYAHNSVPLGHGRNIINVILVDFRALDTLGETAVMGITAVAVLALVHRERKR